ncbi:hypothetical protein F2P81_022003 [Scophthalmus maximus]|uniref:Phosphatidylethanolamine N-methyltransferase n=1 Tax=Scophthalmus maximus TaxID=52904 RepID=A0A6A4S109_SCOMX|nr:hypothetical protein F2P81_022003 [Scophthalmus maximus]
MQLAQVQGWKLASASSSWNDKRLRIRRFLYSQEKGVEEILSDCAAPAAVRNNNPAGVRHTAPLDCCGGFNNVDYSKMDLTLMEELLKRLAFHDHSFCVAVITIILNPLFWNVIRLHFLCDKKISLHRETPLSHVLYSVSVICQVARWEHRTRRISRLFGSPYLACYCLGFVIVMLNASVATEHVRTIIMQGKSYNPDFGLTSFTITQFCLQFLVDTMPRHTNIAISQVIVFSMTVAMKAQARWDVMDTTGIFYAGIALIALGTLLVVSSFLALGYTGTFLGDYFGILMDEKVTGFPFNVVENPMYWGSTANYLGLALMVALTMGRVSVVIKSCDRASLQLRYHRKQEDAHRLQRIGIQGTCNLAAALHLGRVCVFMYKESVNVRY